MRLKLSIALLLAVASGRPGAFAQETAFKVVVNPANPASSLPRAQLSRMFMKKVQAWEDGQKVTPVDQSETSAVRGVFSRSVHREAAGTIKSYWLQQVFAGRLVPPAELPSDTEVLAFVRNHVGAVGYVSAAAATRGVKVLEVTE